ncbi:MAG: VWA domain-containing protein [Candidatus Marinimicrobia bacterium]|mgnify:FL=1|jgi:Ca-activated chloride channel family protein|nr:VWA domain-containing protein [Candidatus Neomarinimicrobiota bacterium]HJM46999.1 VWA domain-containing protein [Candidatus Neomarinimicrobiota bacterium]|tara:strand:- start:13019 stop:13987 length:969 start_codon:yes stop_codon:yes gene_type:complete
MNFASPWYLCALVLIPLLEFWYRKYGQRKEGVVQISSKELIIDSFISGGKYRHLILRILGSILLFLIILGLARPQQVDTLEKSKVDVVDIVLVLDISSSMLAEDFKPNRLEAVKRTAAQFIDSRSGDRIALLVFAGETFIQCPLTVDTEVIGKLLSEVTVAERAYDGTAIGMAIVNAVNRLRGSTAKSKVMVLLSDGSNNAGELDPLTAADIAKEFDIKIYTIGAGTNQATTFIPNKGYIKNEIDEETLKEISIRTKGRYFRATDEESLRDIYSEIDKLERTEIEVKEYTRFRELYGVFFIPALFIGLFHETLERLIFKRGI